MVRVSVSFEISDEPKTVTAEHVEAVMECNFCPNFKPLSINDEYYELFPVNPKDNKPLGDALWIACSSCRRKFR
jgi:hypothetical protein